MHGRTLRGNRESLCSPAGTQGGERGIMAALGRIRLAVRRKRKDRLTALYHHVYNVNHLREAYFALKREAAPGVDGETWPHYGQDLETQLHDLSGPPRRGAYPGIPERRWGAHTS